MKRNLVIALVCLFVSMMLFSSCVNNDEKYLEVGLPISTTIGTLNDAGDGRLYIDSDLGNTLYVKNSEMLSSTGFEAGQRIYAEFPAPMVNKTPFVGEVELLYVQDAAAADYPYDGGYSLHCPNCGAPVTNLGEKQCAYCGTAIVVSDQRVWSFDRIAEVD